MKSTRRIMIGLLAGTVLILGAGHSASNRKTVSRNQALETETFRGPSSMPGSSPEQSYGSSPEQSYGLYTAFDPRNIPELHGGLSRPVFQPLPPNLMLDPSPPENNDPHRLPFVPASQNKPPPMGTSIPVLDRMPAGYTDMNEWEDDRVFSSNLYTDTSFYANWITKARHLSSKTQGSFYEQNLRYDLYTTKNNGDSLGLVIDTTHSNDKREYKEGFTLNQFQLESKTPRSLLVLGHAYPQMSDYTITQQIMGLYGVQRFYNTEISGFVGYKVDEKDDLKNPRNVSGVRLEHRHDDVVTLGLNAVLTDDVHDNPAADTSLPTLSNRVYSLDVRIRPTENIYVKGEYAGSNTDFDQRNGRGFQDGEAYMFEAGFDRENFQAKAGVEAADTEFLTPLGESPRDERAYYGSFYYELNRYFSAKISDRQARDNLAGYKRATLVRDQPEVQMTLKPSEYYRDLRVDFFFQPLHEYSDNGDFVNRYRDLLWMEITQHAGAMRYFAGLSTTIDKDKITPLNDRDIDRLDFRLTWEYDKSNQVYGLYSREHLNYKRAGGMDKVIIYGLGGQSLFHEDISLNLDYTHENNDPTAGNWDTSHDRLNFSLTKEYNNMARLILFLEGSNNRFLAQNRTFADFSARIRYLRAF